LDKIDQFDIPAEWMERIKQLITAEIEPLKEKIEDLERQIMLNPLNEKIAELERKLGADFDGKIA
jgi:tetrahydromethanopterin S-methyltransferase subunit B